MPLRSGKDLTMAQAPEHEWTRSLEENIQKLSQDIQKLAGDSSTANKSLENGLQTLINENVSFGKNLNEISTQQSDKPDSSGLKVSPFSGLQKEDATLWLGKFTTLCHFHKWNNDKSINAFRLLLTGPAELWFQTLTVAEKGNWDTVKTKFWINSQIKTLGY